MNSCLPGRADHKTAFDCAAQKRLEVLALKVGRTKSVNHHANVYATFDCIAQSAEQSISDHVAAKYVVNNVDRVFGVLDHPDFCSDRIQCSLIR